MGSRVVSGLLGFERKPELQAGRDGAGCRGGSLLVERHWIEGSDTEVLPVGADEHGCGALLLRAVALDPVGDQLVALPLDRDGLEGSNGGRRVVEACTQHGLGLAAGDLAVCSAVVTTGGDEDADDHGHDDERHDDHDGERLARGLGVVDGLVLALVHPGRDWDLSRVGFAGTGGGHFDHSLLLWFVDPG